MPNMTPDELVHAIQDILKLNGYSVKVDFKIGGAQIDLMAKSLSDPFAPEIYIEATTEYVDNAKYGKDLTKLSLVREQDPSATCMIISSSGFTADVVERATLSRYLAVTYDEFFRKFERFDRYLEIVHNSAFITDLVEHYEEPSFEDQHGRELATTYLKSWRDSDRAKGQWLVILGDYGTGKTALTQVLQYRWLLEYKTNPSLPLPIRLELRDFTKQFDHRSLLHHFLDSNRLAHIPLEFIFALIKRGKILLLLDGYDEMAQFMNVRERRACMAALAQLAADGAKGILTSRPNFFTEEEEFQVFEVLYAMLSSKSYHISKTDLDFLQQERKADALITQLLLDKYERHLRDLGEVEIKHLVSRRLKDNVEAREIVLKIINKVFRQSADGSYTSLGGKPVIVSYLLELVSEPG